MRRILFVDDEPRVLAGLERTFMALDNEWEMEFVGSGKEALEYLNARTAGVYAANILASEAGACADDSKRGGLDEKFLESMGVTEEQVASWRLSAKKAADENAT